MHELHEVDVDCPYCGESIGLLVDTSAGPQEYVEDCAVCCRPMTVRLTVDRDGEPGVSVLREDDV